MVVLLAVLAGAAPASAGWKMDRSLAVANEAFDRPCDGQVRLSWASAVTVFDSLPYSTAGWADPFECVIWLNADRHYSWHMICRTVLHEMGHIVGLDHHDHGLMRPEQDLIEGWVVRDGRRRWVVSGSDPRCRERGRPFLGL